MRVYYTASLIALLFATTQAIAQDERESLKIYISVDMEGLAGAVRGRG